MSLGRVLRLSIRTAAALAAIAVLAPYTAFAQNAQLSGFITDPSGAAVPKAQVTVSSEPIALTRSTTSNDSGVFAFNGLPSGVYTVVVVADGFQPTSLVDITLAVAENARLDVVLAIGGVQDQVVVQGTIRRADGSVATVVDRSLIDRLPMNGRTFQRLITMAPGVNVAKSTINQTPGQFTVNGQRTDANYFTLDGLSVNFGVTSNAANAQGFAGSHPALGVTGSTSSLVSVDELEEFRIQTSSFAPEFGRSPGAQVQLLTRSGSSRLTFSAFEYFRDESMDANDWFANASSQPKAQLRQHNFGGTLGGPLIASRLFAFGSYEGLRLKQPRTIIGLVPSLATRQNSPAAVRPLLDAFPLPTGEDTRNPTTRALNGLAEFAGSDSDTIDTDSYSLRLDTRLAQGRDVFFRYSGSPTTSVSRVGAVANLANEKIETRNATAGANLMLLGGSVDVRVGYATQTADIRRTLDDWAGATVPADAALFPLDAARRPDRSGFQLVIDGNLGGYLDGPLTSNEQHQLNAVFSTTYVFGSHVIKAGGDYRRLTPLRGPAEYQLTMNATSLSSLNGLTINQVIRQNNAQAEPIFDNVSAYMQDTWSISSRLSATYGVRWDYNPAPREANGRDAFRLTNTDDPSAFALVPRGGRLYDIGAGNFAPRLGLSYRVHESARRSTLLRAGVGLFNVNESIEVGRAFSGYPFNITVTDTNVRYPLSTTSSAIPALPSNFSPPWVGSVISYPDDVKSARTAQMNIGVEHQTGAWTIGLAYVGARGWNFVRQENRTAPNANLPGNITILRTDAQSWYDSLQLQVTRRLTGSLGMFGSYTWSKAIDEVSDAVTSVRLKGPADYDRRHVGNIAVSWVPNVSGRGTLADAVLGGWSIDAMARFHSAAPIKIVAASAIRVDGVLQETRPDFDPDRPVYIDDPLAPGGKRLNTETDPARPGCLGAFCVPAAGRQGNLGRNLIRGLGAWQADLALRREFRVNSRGAVSVALELFNVFNHPSFADPEGSMTNPRFGVATSMLNRSLGGLSPLYQLGGPRSVQLVSRFKF
jgi:hypothetical protein